MVSSGVAVAAIVFATIVTIFKQSAVGCGN